MPGGEVLTPSIVAFDAAQSDDLALRADVTLPAQPGHRVAAWACTVTNDDIPSHPPARGCCGSRPLEETTMAAFAPLFDVSSVRLQSERLITLPDRYRSQPHPRASRASRPRHCG